MATLIKYAALAAFYLSTFTNAQITAYPVEKACGCYTATTYITNNGCPAFEPTKPCIVPMCAMLTTSTIPGPNTRCPKTPTLTSFLPCETACRSGCAIFTTTLTYSSSCLPTAPTKPTTHPNPTTPPHVTTTRPPKSSKSCYTKTVSATKKCPEDEFGCAPPDCIYLSTTNVPAGPVDGCPVTPTVVAPRTCKGTCDYACGTQWVTATATAWVA